MTAFHQRPLGDDEPPPPELHARPAREHELVVDNVSKRYERPSRLLRPFVRAATRGTNEALRGASLTVAAGEVVGLVGPNGAGKTTLIKIISTLLEATSGTVRVGGVDVSSDPRHARGRLGLVLSDDRGLHWRLTGRQNLEFFGVMAGLPRAPARARATEVLERVRLADNDTLVFGFSAGMRTRLNVARALLADPPLVLLDEPTRSLDPTSTEATWSLLRDLATRGKAVLVSSHDLASVASWCDRVILLVGGQVRWSRSVRGLQSSGDRAATLISLFEREAQVTP